MEMKPITTFLKVVSILILIQGILGILTSAVAVFLKPAVDEAIGGDTHFMWLSLAVCTVCAVVNVVLAVMALRHKNIALVYRISVVTLMFSVVFGFADGGGVSSIVSSLIGAVIPALFCYSLFNQNKMDQNQ